MHGVGLFLRQPHAALSRVSTDMIPLTGTTKGHYVSLDMQGCDDMRDWPQDLFVRRFEPREVKAITGVPEDRQRLLAARHFDFRESVTEDGRRRRWSWDGIQALAVFEEVMAASRNADLAQKIVQLLHRDQSFILDARSGSPDTLIVARDATGAIDVTDVDGLAAIVTEGHVDERPASVQAFNLSAIQRRLGSAAKISGEADDV